MNESDGKVKFAIAMHLAWKTAHDFAKEFGLEKDNKLIWAIMTLLIKKTMKW